MEESNNGTPQLDEVPTFLQNENWHNEDISGCWLDFTEPYKPPRWTLSHNGKRFAKPRRVVGHHRQERQDIVHVDGDGGDTEGSYGGMHYEFLTRPSLLCCIDTEQGKDDSIAIKNRV